MLNNLIFDASVPKKWNSCRLDVCSKTDQCRLKNNNKMKIFPIHRLNKDTRFNGNIPATNQTKENKNCTLKDLRKGLRDTVIITS